MSCECNLIKIDSNNCLCNPTNANWKQIILNQIIILPEKYPDIMRINSVKMDVNILNTTFVQTPDSLDIPNAEGTYLTGLKLIVNGEITETISYNGDDVCKIYNYRTSQVFSTFIVLDPGFDVCKPVSVDACIEGALIQPLDERAIQQNIGVFVRVL